MAVAIECISIVVLRTTIEEKYPGGWEQCLKDHICLLGGRVWYDDYLLRDGSMSPMDMEDIIEWWAEKGFETHAGSDNPTKWLDVCVIDICFGVTLPCDWIEVHGDVAAIKGGLDSKVFGRSDFKEELLAADRIMQEYLLNN